MSAICIYIGTINHNYTGLYGRGGGGRGGGGEGFCVHFFLISLSCFSFPSFRGLFSLFFFLLIVFHCFSLVSWISGVADKMSTEPAQTDL